ncbi:MAG: hypothetical protein R3336_03695 [Phycisphaeraceae bacterium]|nr:hypothetical protein [Phycisphaeraceae bacterium]
MSHPKHVSRLIDAARLLRADLAVATVSGVAMMVWLNGAGPAADTWSITALLAAVIAGLGLHGFGMVFNDLIDLRRDRQLRPDRPVAAGRVRASTAAMAGTASLVIGLLAAAWLGLGAMVAAVLIAGGLLFYNAAGKFLPATAAMTLGLARVGVMLLPDPTTEHLYPLWLAMSHTVAAAAITARLTPGQRALGNQHAWILCGMWVFFSMALLLVDSLRDNSGSIAGAQAWPLLALLAAGFAALATWHVRRRLGGRAGAGETARFFRIAVLWLILYDVAWMIGVGQWLAAGLLAGLFFVATGLTLRLTRPVDDDPRYRVDDRSSGLSSTGPVK